MGHSLGKLSASSVVWGLCGNIGNSLSELLQATGANYRPIDIRYYGKSTPFNITLETPAEQMQWLNTAQALADVPVIRTLTSLCLGIGY